MLMRFVVVAATDVDIGRAVVKEKKNDIFQVHTFPPVQLTDWWYCIEWLGLLECL